MAEMFQFPVNDWLLQLHTCRYLQKKDPAFDLGSLYLRIYSMIMVMSTGTRNSSIKALARCFSVALSLALTCRFWRSSSSKSSPSPPLLAFYIGPKAEFNLSSSYPVLSPGSPTSFFIPPNRSQSSLKQLST